MAKNKKIEAGRINTGFFHRIIVFLMLIMILPSILSVPAKAETVEISKKKVVMEVDSELQLKVLGSSDTEKWSSSDKNVASITKKGKIKAKKEGTAEIRVKTNKKTLKCHVTVVDSNKEQENDQSNDKSKIFGGIKKGEILYDGESITVAYYGWELVDDYDDDNRTKAVCLELMITNKMDDVIEIQSDCITLNGYSFNGIVMSDSVSSGKKGIVYPTIYDFRDELVNLDDVFNIGGTFTIIKGGFMGSVSNKTIDFHTVSFDYESK